jgi:hypothetical protein
LRPSKELVFLCSSTPLLEIYDGVINGATILFFSREFSSLSWNVKNEGVFMKIFFLILAN